MKKDYVVTIESRDVFADYVFTHKVRVDDVYLGGLNKRIDELRDEFVKKLFPLSMCKFMTMTEEGELIYELIPSHEDTQLSITWDEAED